VKDKDRYFLLKKEECPGLRFPSIIDLKYVYKCERYNSAPITFVPDFLNDQILDKFLKYEYLIKDDDCEEFMQLIS
ncbi:hypothetical protein, partial [Alkalibacillus haloalkaliphilus]|uniref:hypothetical protein n=1 Tax=Alkalibacillus haloalkaliphilus TaxID=94136 RepID=UPI000590E763